MPLRTQGRWIVDANGARFKLTAVNWYGAEEQDHVVSGLDHVALSDLVGLIQASGFNTVWLPWSNEMFENGDFPIDPARLAANPDLQGRTAMDVFEAVVDALTAQGVAVILDNHGSSADWCCSRFDGNAHGYADGYDENQWVEDWKDMVKRFAPNPLVVGADLRNDLRKGADGPTLWSKWATAAERAGNALLDINPDLLIIVEGVNYATDLTGVYTRPVALNRGGHLVYEAHDYPWDHFTGAKVGDKNVIEDQATTWKRLGDNGGYILAEGKPYTAPVWVGEFGTWNTGEAQLQSGNSTDYGHWFQSFRRYLANADIDWSYWSLNGTQATGTQYWDDGSAHPRGPSQSDGFGILTPDWKGPKLMTTKANQTPHPELLEELQALTPATQGPGLTR